MFYINVYLYDYYISIGFNDCYENYNVDFLVYDLYFKF